MLRDTILIGAAMRVRDAVSPLKPETGRQLLLEIAAELDGAQGGVRFSADPLIVQTTPSLVEKARIFATAAHAAVGQKRKYTGRPYIEHPAAVVEIVKSVEHTPEMLAAAWLHDVVEDTEVGTHIIRELFGDEVLTLVDCLTETKAIGRKRPERKAFYRDRIAMAPAAAQTIKLADLIDNTPTIVEHDPKFAAVYLAEKEELLKVLIRGNHQLRSRAITQVEHARRALAVAAPAPSELSSAVVSEIAQELAGVFRTFGCGRVQETEPISEAVKDGPLRFAAGTDVAAVVHAVAASIERRKAAARVGDGR